MIGRLPSEIAELVPAGDLVIVDDLTLEQARLIIAASTAEIVRQRALVASATAERADARVLCSSRLDHMERAERQRVKAEAQRDAAIADAKQGWEAAQKAVDGGQLLSLGTELLKADNARLREAMKDARTCVDVATCGCCSIVADRLDRALSAAGGDEGKA